MADNAMKTGTLFKPEVVKQLISKVQGKSVLAKFVSTNPNSIQWSGAIYLQP
ncbi:major head protein [Streptococcus pneumoniae]|nr:major head protein [Streptococcus pneumoniae]